MISKYWQQEYLPFEVQLKSSLLRDGEQEPFALIQDISCEARLINNTTAQTVYEEAGERDKRRFRFKKLRFEESGNFDLHLDVSAEVGGQTVVIQRLRQRILVQEGMPFQLSGFAYRDKVRRSLFGPDADGVGSVKVGDRIVYWLVPILKGYSIAGVEAAPVGPASSIIGWQSQQSDNGSFAGTFYVGESEPGVILDVAVVKDGKKSSYKVTPPKLPISERDRRTVASILSRDLPSGRSLYIGERYKLPFTVRLQDADRLLAEGNHGTVRARVTRPARGKKPGESFYADAEFAEVTPVAGATDVWDLRFLLWLNQDILLYDGLYTFEIEQLPSLGISVTGNCSFPVVEPPLALTLHSISQDPTTFRPVLWAGEAIACTVEVAPDTQLGNVHVWLESRDVDGVGQPEFKRKPHVAIEDGQGEIEFRSWQDGAASLYPAIQFTDLKRPDAPLVEIHFINSIYPIAPRAQSMEIEFGQVRISAAQRLPVNFVAIQTVHKNVQTYQPLECPLSFRVAGGDGAWRKSQVNEILAHFYNDPLSLVSIGIDGQSESAVAPDSLQITADDDKSDLLEQADRGPVDVVATVKFRLLRAGRAVLRYKDLGDSGDGSSRNWLEIKSREFDVDPSDVHLLLSHQSLGIDLVDTRSAPRSSDEFYQAFSIDGVTAEILAKESLDGLFPKLMFGNKFDKELDSLGDGQARDDGLKTTHRAMVTEPGIGKHKVVCQLVDVKDKVHYVFGPFTVDVQEIKWKFELATVPPQLIPDNVITLDKLSLYATAITAEDHVAEFQTRLTFRLLVDREGQEGHLVSFPISDEQTTFDQNTGRFELICHRLEFQKEADFGLMPGDQLRFKVGAFIGERSLGDYDTLAHTINVTERPFHILVRVNGKIIDGKVVNVITSDRVEYKVEHREDSSWPDSRLPVLGIYDKDHNRLRAYRHEKSHDGFDEFFFAAGVFHVGYSAPIATPARSSHEIPGFHLADHVTLEVTRAPMSRLAFIGFVVLAVISGVLVLLLLAGGVLTVSSVIWRSFVPRIQLALHETDRDRLGGKTVQQLGAVSDEFTPRIGKWRARWLRVFPPRTEIWELFIGGNRAYVEFADAPNSQLLARQVTSPRGGKVTFGPGAKESSNVFPRGTWPFRGDAWHLFTPSEDESTLQIWCNWKATDSADGYLRIRKVLNRVTKRPSLATAAGTGNPNEEIREPAGKTTKN